MRIHKLRTACDILIAAVARCGLSAADPGGMRFDSELPRSLSRLFACDVDDGIDRDGDTATDRRVKPIST